MNRDKGKAVWNSTLTEIFIKECLEQVYKKQRKGTAFNKNGWQAIIEGFEAKTGKKYERKQLKNKLDNMRKEWNVWHKLFSSETGLGWDSDKNTVDAPDEWWERKILENPLYEKFRYKGLRFARELTLIFKDVLATGETLFVPSATQTQIEDDDDEDVYRPTIDLREGSGDSEEELNLSDTIAPTGVTDELLGLNVTINTGGTSGDGSQGKRKRVVGVGGRKKQKVPASMKIADAMSEMAKDNRARTETVNKILANDIGVSEVVAHLNGLPEVFGDKDLHWRCVNLVLYKPMRDAYWQLKDHPDHLVNWLKHQVYHLPDFISKNTSG
ncbi:L10-interacting MYB domain-containing protein-like [Prosopis cineraria]|uniref:L10-interacting MYB domain-containing protein-like n=1 Tax=Prosopis cineraria TaxID=364024 RepID=UPI0024101E38|nr:L10-interacting MYB domain-containing protein-like [Prosopis cineraria]